MEQGVERNGFTFYRSYYEAACELPDKQRLALYDAITQYALNDEIIELSKMPKAMFALIRPTLDTSKTKSQAGISSGAARRNNSSNNKGTEHEQNANRTRTECEQNANRTRTEREQNVNKTRTEREQNVKDVDIDIDIDKDKAAAACVRAHVSNKILSLYEKSFKKLISPDTAEFLLDWSDILGEDTVIFAIEHASGSNENIISPRKYLESVLQRWQRKGVNTVAQAKELLDKGNKKHNPVITTSAIKDYSEEF